MLPFANNYSKSTHVVMTVLVMAVQGFRLVELKSRRLVVALEHWSKNKKRTKKQEKNKETRKEQRNKKKKKKKEKRKKKKRKKKKEKKKRKKGKKKVQWILFSPVTFVFGFWLLVFFWTFRSRLKVIAFCPWSHLWRIVLEQALLNI